MVIQVQRLRLLFTGLVLFYYAGFMSFCSMLLLGKSRSVHGEIVEAGGGNAIRQLLGLAILALGMFFLLRLKDKSLSSFTYRHSSWLLLLGFIVLSVFWSVEPGVSVRRILAMFILFISALILLYEFPPEKALTFVARAVGVAALVGIAYAVISPRDAFIQGDGQRAGAFLGIFSDKNAGARSYVYGLVLFYGLGLYKKGTDKVLFCSLILGVLLSRSATAAAMSVAGIGLVWLFNRSRVTGSPQRTFNRLMVVTVSLVLAVVLGNMAYTEILLLLGRDPTLTNRTIIWELLQHRFEVKPLLGYGFGAFWSSDYVLDFVEDWGFIGNAHSSYMEMRLIGGYVGLVLLMYSFFGSFVRGLRSFTVFPETSLFAMVAAILLLQAGVGYVAFIIPNHVSFDMFIFALMSVLAGRYSLSNNNSGFSGSNSLSGNRANCSRSMLVMSSDGENHKP